MIRSYLKTAWRSLLRFPLTMSVTVGGLIVGMTGTLLIGLYILDELRYDQHLTKKELLFRLTTVSENGKDAFRSALTRADLGPRIKRDIPAVAEFTRLLPVDDVFLFIDGNAFKEKIIYTDPKVVEIFDISLIIGSKKSCLAEPSSIVLSETTAVKLFGEKWRDSNILDKELLVDGRIPMRIKGVFQDLSVHSHLTSNLFASIPDGLDWMAPDSKLYTYIELEKGAEPATVSQVIKTLIIPDSEHGVQNHEIALQPITEIHLFSDYESDNAVLGSIRNIYALVVGAIFLLAITILNFVNLFTARSLHRVKELGIRKVIGAFSYQLRVQFFVETFLVAILSLIGATVLVIAFLPAFNGMTGKSLSSWSFFQADVLILAVSVTGVIGVVAGFYPSLVLSRAKILEGLSGSKGQVRAPLGWRKTLLSVQFFIATIMVTISLVSFNQMEMVMNKPLGFDKENTIALANPYMIGSLDNIKRLREELRTVPGVEDVSITGYSPSQTRWVRNYDTFCNREPLHGRMQPAKWLVVDDRFVPTMGLVLLSGRNFVEDHDVDSLSIIINEKAVEAFALNTGGKDPIGSELSFARDGHSDPLHYTVVGVVSDFDFGSLHDPITPTIMMLGYHRFEFVARLSPNHPKTEVLRKMELVWARNLPAIPFEYYFIRDRFERLHRADVAAGNIFSLFCLITIFVSGFGLFSIAAYTIVRRAREIAIRKILGATEQNIIMQITQEFLPIILVAYFLAVPVSEIIARKWTEEFAYKVELDSWIFLQSGLILFAISLIALAYQSWTAARTNPVSSLRSLT